jgi:hypothetical protein
MAHGPIAGKDAKGENQTDQESGLFSPITIQVTHVFNELCPKKNSGKEIRGKPHLLLQKISYTIRGMRVKSPDFIVFLSKKSWT